jgi:hypothetical protein
MLDQGWSRVSKGCFRSRRPGATARASAALVVAALLLALLCATSRPALAQFAVDLELVLAVDASGSVDDDEYTLQLSGIAAAFRDPEVVQAIARGFHGHIAVALLVWSDAHVGKDRGKWYIIRSREDAEAFALLAEHYPRRVRNGATGIGAGIGAAVDMMRHNGLDGARRVVDVSGDGVESPLDTSLTIGAMLLKDVYKLVDSQGVIVNGLAITNDVPNLDVWYDNNVRMGSGSFVIRAESYADFERAMRAKLLKEIDQTAPVTLLEDRAPAAAPEGG